jgi:hypothetical protein
MVSSDKGGLGVGLRVFAPACLRVGNTANDFNACAGVVAAFAVVFLAAGCAFAVLGFAFALRAGFLATAFLAVGFLAVVFLIAIFFSPC